ASCSMWKAPKTHTWGTATAPEQYERLLWEAAKSGDLNQIARHLSSSYVRIGPGGRLDREAALDHLRKLRLTSFEISDLNSAPAGDNTIVTYTLALHGSYSGSGGDSQALAEQPWRVMTV